MKAIQKELGDKDDFKSEILEFEDQLKKKDIPEDIKTRIEKEIKKLKGMSSMSAEATVVRNYIDWLVNLPWNSDLTEDEISIDNAQKVLDNDHFGLEKPQRKDYRVSCCQGFNYKAERTYIVFGWPSRSRKNFFS